MDESDQTFTIDEAVKAQKAMRQAARLGEAHFPVPALVGMLSDEIEALRKAGQSDADIASLIETATGKPLGGDAIAQHYAEPDARHPGKG